MTVVLDGLPGRSETFLRRHIEHFDADVVARRRGADVLETATVAGELRCLDEGRSDAERLLPKILRRGREVALGTRAPAWSRSMTSFFERYLEDRRPDVVLAEFGPNAICAADACERHATPLVAHFHGYDASAMLRFPRYREALLGLFASASAVVAVSHDMARRLERLGCPRSKLHVVPCGAALDDLECGAGVDRQPCHFLAVARMIPLKAPMDTLQAFRTLSSRVPGVTLQMIGDGPLLADVRAALRRWGLEDVVRVPGGMPWIDVRRALQAAGAFVHPSVTTPQGHVEGWGVAMAEAAATGLPVIATRSGGIPDHVQDGVTGLLVEEHDVAGLTNAMEGLAADPDLRRRMGVAGRANILEVGNVAIQLERLGDLLRDASQRRPE